MPKPEVKPGQELEKVVQDFEDGKYRIPQFQREFVWNVADVRRLFDSIYQHYPIGTIFLWNPPKEKRSFFRTLKNLDQPSIEEMIRSEISFVLDGQQRLVSLYVTFKGMEFMGNDYSQITFNLNEEKFRKAKGEAEHLVKVSDIISPNFFDIAQNLSEEDREKLETCRDRIKSYPLSLVTVKHDDFDSVKSVFKRINERGRKLSRFDKINANLWGKEFNLRRRVEEDIDSVTRVTFGFGNVKGDMITQALALNIHGSCRTRTQKNMKSEEVVDEWRNTKESIILATRYLNNSLGVKQIGFLPYAGMLPVLSYYFRKTDNSTLTGHHKDVIDKWFWRVGMSGYYTKKTQTLMTKDTELIDDLIETGSKELYEQLNFGMNKEELKQELINTNVKRTTAFRNVFLCILAKQEPRHFKNNEPVNLTSKYYANFQLNRHHIFPNAYLRSEGYGQDARKSIMDIAFIPRDLNNEISDEKPSKYMSESQSQNDNFEECLKSHLIPIDNSGIWEDDYEKFLENRADLFVKRIKELTEFNL